MKTITQKIASLLLIPIMLFSTTSFGISKHICMGSIYSISYLGEAEDCGMEMGNPSNDVPADCSIILDDDCCETERTSINRVIMFDDNCCKTERASIKGTISDQIQNSKFKVADYSLLTAFIISKYNLFQGSIKTLNLYKDYSPPKVTKNISVLYQVFII